MHSPNDRWLALDRILATLFQTHCLLCEGRARDGRFCEGGHHLLRVPDTTCAWCGEILSQAAAQCGVCAGGKKFPLHGKSLFRLNEDARRLLHRIKFGGYRGLVRWLTPWLEAWTPWDDLTGFTLVPVPLHPRRYWSRGFNLSEELSETLGRAWGLPVVSALAKVRAGTDQALLNREDRQKNLRHSFEFIEACGDKVILVDDVFTTGATFLACARVLETHKIKEVRTASAFRTPLFKTR